MSKQREFTLNANLISNCNDQSEQIVFFFSSQCSANETGRMFFLSLLTEL